jgi:hypothetical protein
MNRQFKISQNIFSGHGCERRRVKKYYGESFLYGLAAINTKTQAAIAAWVLWSLSVWKFMVDFQRLNHL